MTNLKIGDSRHNNCAGKAYYYNNTYADKKMF